MKKPKKPKVKSSSAIQKNRNLSPLPQEPIQNPAKSLPQTNTAGQQQQDKQKKNPLKRWSLVKRAVRAVGGLIPPKRPKGL